MESTWTTRDLDDLRTTGRSGEITKLKEKDRIETTLKQLNGIFSGLRESFERGVSKCWMDDEWSRGAWAFVGLTDFFTASAREGRIHFAGEHLFAMVFVDSGALSSRTAGGEGG